MLRGRLGERPRFLLESLETQIPIFLCIAFRQYADLNVTRHSAILAEDLPPTANEDCSRFFSLAIRFLFAYHCNHRDKGVMSLWS